MNFKTLAIAAGFAFAAASSFAGDITITPETALDAATVVAYGTDIFAASATTATVNNAVIFQTGAADHAAFIEQNTTANAFASIVQTADLPAVAVISQSTAAGGRASIYQH